MTPRVTRGIAVYQIVAGLWGLADPARRMFAEAHTTGQYTLATLVTAFMLTSVVAGALLWRGSRGGRPLSRIVQALQVPVLASKWLVYTVTLGLACSLSIRGLGPAVWFGVGPYVTIDFTPLSYVPQIGLNVVPLVLWYLLRASIEPSKGADQVVAQAAA